eukprot:GHVT01088507.1.p1 GENE.GHVT01088507.1~~GHVT01088507.1.p1  ORF type:complete len:509 (+),score=120.97 GHVT01088507.1:522-2048(+)
MGQQTEHSMAAALPPNSPELKAALRDRTDSFFRSLGLCLQIYHLPLTPPASPPAASVSSSGASSVASCSASASPSAGVPLLAPCAAPSAVSSRSSASSTRAGPAPPPSSASQAPQSSEPAAPALPSTQPSRKVSSSEAQPLHPSSLEASATDAHCSALPSAAAGAADGRANEAVPHGDAAGGAAPLQVSGDSSRPASAAGSGSPSCAPGAPVEAGRSLLSSIPCVSQFSNSTFPSFVHWINRQKRVMKYQLLSNRSLYLSSLNPLPVAVLPPGPPARAFSGGHPAPIDPRAGDSSRATVRRGAHHSHKPSAVKHAAPAALCPHAFVDLPESLEIQLDQMATDIASKDFQGIWVGLRTPSVPKATAYGALAVRRTVAWALVEIFSNNERCLRGVYVNRCLRPSALACLLRAFLPRALLEGFELDAPVSDELSPWRFFSVWLCDLNVFPRPSWLLLCAEEFLNLDIHFDCPEIDNIIPNGHIDQGCACKQVAQKHQIANTIRPRLDARKA